MSGSFGLKGFLTREEALCFGSTSGWVGLSVGFARAWKVFNPITWPGFRSGISSLGRDLRFTGLRATQWIWTRAPMFPGGALELSNNVGAAVGLLILTAAQHMSRCVTKTSAKPA